MTSVCDVSQSDDTKTELTCLCFKLIKKYSPSNYINIYEQKIVLILKSQI